MKDILKKRIKRTPELLTFLTNKFNEAMFRKDYSSATDISRFKINIQLNRFKCKYFISSNNEGEYFIGLLLSEEVLYIEKVPVINIETYLSDNFGIRI
jgi:hypothetical protein